MHIEENMRRNMHFKRSLVIKYGYILILISFIFAAIRPYAIGTDTRDYVNGFLNPNESIQNRNIGFNLLSSALRTIYPNGRFFLIIMSAILSLFVHLSIKLNSRSYTYSALCYIFLYYFVTLNILRQSIAMAVIFSIGLFMIKRRRYIEAIIIIMVMSSFHEISLIMLFILPFIPHRKNEKIIFIVWIISVLSIFAINRDAFNKIFLNIELLLNIILKTKIPNYLHYADILYSNNISIVSTCLYNALYLIILICTHKYSMLNNSNYVCEYNILFFGIILQNSLIRFEILNRVPLFLLFSLISISSYIYKASKKYGLLLLMSYMAIFIVRFIINGNSGVVNNHI